MATVKEILDAAGGSYPSMVKERRGEPGWLDLTRAVRVVIGGKKLGGICLLNPSKELAILNSSGSPVLIANLVIAGFQGMLKIGNDLTEKDMDELEIFLNIVADERMPGPDGSDLVQTANAAVARVFISRFFMTRQKGLIYKPKSGS
jgi:hypothetical protein